MRFARRAALGVLALTLIAANASTSPRRPVAAAINHNVVAPLVIVASGGRVGTGTVVSSTRDYSLVLTADHIIQLSSSVLVASPLLRRTAPAQVVSEDAVHDLALLRIAIGRLPCFCMANKTYRNEHIGLASFSRDSSLTNPVVYTSLDHQINTDTHRGIFIHDATLEDGFSGGPVFDMNSQLLVGVIKGFAKGATVEHVAVDISTISRFLSHTAYAAEFSAIDTEPMGAPPPGRVTVVGLSVGLNRGPDDNTGPNPALEAIEALLHQQLSSSIEVDRRVHYLAVETVGWRFPTIPYEISDALEGFRNAVCDSSMVGTPVVIAIDHHDVAVARHGNAYPFSTEARLFFGTCRMFDMHQYGVERGDPTADLRSEIGDLAQGAVRTGRLYYFVEVGETKQFPFQSSATERDGYQYEHAVNEEIRAMRNFFRGELSAESYDQADAIVNFVYRGSFVGTGFWRPSFQITDDGDKLVLSVPLGVETALGKSGRYRYRQSDASTVAGATVTSVAGTPLNGPWDTKKANAILRMNGPARLRMALHLTENRNVEVFAPIVNTCGMLQLEYAPVE